MKVSICIPIYNVEKYVRRCLESLINQTYQDLEIIIVNDCTPDNSMSVIHEFAQTDSRIAVINHECNKGLMMARYTAYMNATGDYITFLDSDDYLPDNSIAKLVEAMKRSEADVVSGHIEYIYCNGERELWKNHLNYGSDRKSVLKSLLNREFGHNLCSKIFKRELLQDNKYSVYDNFNNGEDGMLFYQIVNNSNKIVQIPDVVYYYCQNLQSSSHVNLSEYGIQSILMLNRVRKEVCAPYPDIYRPLFNYISPTILSLYLKNFIDGTQFKKYISLNGLDEFLKFKNLLRYLSFRNSIVLLNQFLRSKIKWLRSL